MRSSSSALSGISRSPRRVSPAMLRDLALFRYQLRRFLRFSEEAARACGVTPQQHQLMLGIAGYAEHRSATISELAEFLQERNNSVVGLVERAVQSGLVRRETSASDRRQVIVTLTSHGEEILTKLSELHNEEVQQMRTGFLTGKRPNRRTAGEEGMRRTARKVTA